MNKIYKVVWSKVKHCYVVTSELAKRQTKGCGARSLRMATVSLGVAASLLCSGAVLPVFGESVAEAARHEITTDTSISSDETSTYADGVKMNASNIALTITSTGKVKMIESAGYNNNTITVQGKVICGSSSSSAIWGAATGTKVYIKTGANVQGEIYAGRDDTSEVSGNKLDISSGTIEGNIFGGVNNNITAYDVKNNAITISGSSITGSVIGGTTLSGKASLNTVNISGDATAITGEVVGGRSANSDATENKVIINGGNFDKSVIGGNTTNGKNATDNKVTIEGGTIAGSIYGGWSQNGTGTANSNEVHISGGTIDSEVSGGYVQAGVAGGSTADKGNKVIINGGEVKNGVIGGYSDKGDATYNSASLKGGSVYGIVGGATKEGDATNNSVIIEAGDVKFYYGSVLGGYSDNGDAVDNTVTISGGTLVNTSGVQIKGGEVYDAAHKATGNKVNISNGTIGSNEGSQYKNGFYVIAGDASTRGGNATDNAITISGGSFAGENTFEFYGGKTKNIFTSHSETGEVITATVAANKNTVEISGGTFSDNENVKIYGAYSSASSSAIFGTDSKVTLTATVDENKVKISGGTFSGNVDVYGGYGTASAGVYGSGEEAVTTLTTNGNTVEISGGTFSGNVNVYGGYGHADGTSESGGGTATSSSSADNNKVIISGGTINGYIAGGWATESASGNTVTIKDNAVIGENARIYGGYAASTVTFGTAANNTVNILTAISVKGLYGGIGDSEKSTGNTLNIAAKGVTTQEVGYFQNMNFYLPSDIANNDTMLTVNGGAATDVTGVTFGVAALSGVKLEKGNTVNLITNPNGLTTADTLKTTDSATLAKASFLSANSLTTDDKYELSISKKDANTIIATVDNVTEQKADEGGSGKKAVSIPDVLKSPVETRAGVVTMINAGADLLISQGMRNAADAAAAERTEGDAAAAPRAGGFAPFAAVSFGKLRAESGSHVDNKGIGMNLGFAREIENKNGKLLVGPVIEYGHGSYDSYQDSGIKADGKSSYWGIGVIAKQTNDNGFYYEGSLRAGRTKSDYNSDLRPGLHVNYDSSATYWAAHLGVGKLVDIGHDNTLDYYGKYFYSHTGSDSTYLNGANETANFDAVNSHRIRLGARLTHALNEKNKLYGGLAWQYEFKGDARATYSVSGEAPSPSVKGSSGMIELGWQVKPGKSPMTIDLGVTGWVGKQRGITANLQANWTF